MKKNENFLLDIGKLARGGLFHIFGSSVLAEIGGLVSSIVVIRHLPKLSYGQYVDANNLYSYLTVFIGLGLGSAVLQYCSEPIEDNEKKAIYNFSFRAGMSFNIVLGFLVIIFALFKRKLGQINVAYYLMLMSVLPIITYLTTLIQTILRVRRANKLYAVSNVVLTTTKIIGNIFFTYLWNVSGLIFSVYFSYIISSFTSLVCLRKDGFFKKNNSNEVVLSQNKKIKIVHYAIICATTNFTTLILSLLDVTCLSFVLKDTSVLADYNVAMVIPNACMLIPTGLITYLYPSMVEKCSIGHSDVYQEIKYLLKIFVAISAVITLICLCLGPFAIRVIYGKKYANVIPTFRILCFNFFIFGGIRKILGNMLAALKKVNVNFIHTSLTGILNIIFNLVLIPKYNIIGAAVATVITTSIVAILELVYIYQYFHHCNTKSL